MHFARSLHFFLATALVEVLSFSPRASATIGDIWGGVNITTMVLQVAGAISSPTCNANPNCTALTTVAIPNCLEINGQPACWCAPASLYPVHYCAICMSSPLDNTTTPDQTQTALAGHIKYHIGCNAYDAFANGTVTSNTTSSVTTSSSSSASLTPTLTPTPTPTQAAATSGTKSVSAGTIGGVVVGGLIGLALIAAALCIVYRSMQNKHERIVGSIQRASEFSNDAKHPFGTGDNSPPTAYTPPPNPNTQWGSVPYDTRILHLHPEV
jgi:hypothetical protein